MDKLMKEPSVMRFFRMFTAVAGVGVTIGVVFSLISCFMGSFSVTALILGFYLAPTGLVIFLLECETIQYPAIYSKIIRQFPFLKGYMGRAALYLFVAGQLLALGDTQGYVLGISFLVIAIVGFVYGGFHSEPAHAEQVRDEVNLPQPGIQTLEAKVSEPAGPEFQRPEPGSRSLSDAENPFDSGMQGGANLGTLGSSGEPGSRSLAEAPGIV